MNKSINYVDKILKNAENEMLKLNHPYVGSEHLILALLKDNIIYNNRNLYIYDKLSIFSRFYSGID